MQTHKPQKVKIQEIRAKSILIPSKLPDADYVVNPYTGCEFGCIYCYASFMGRYVNEQIGNWGNYVYVKTNAVDAFEEDIRHLSLEKRIHSTILLSSVTDPYQGIESKYLLTQGVLNVLVKERYPGLISILTKSPLVLRDLDILKKLPNVEVGMTITTMDDKVGRFFERKAPLVSRRLKALRQIHDEGLNTYAFIGPLLPHFRYHPDLLEELFANLAESNVQSIFVEHINMKTYIRERLIPTLDEEPDNVKAIYTEAVTVDHRTILNEMVTQLAEKYKLKLKLDMVIYHGKENEVGGASPKIEN